jgi:hypothetical protein
LNAKAANDKVDLVAQGLQNEVDTRIRENEDLKKKLNETQQELEKFQKENEEQKKMIESLKEQVRSRDEELLKNKAEISEMKLNPEKLVEEKEEKRRKFQEELQEEISRPSSPATAAREAAEMNRMVAEGAVKAMGAPKDPVEYEKAVQEHIQALERDAKKREEAKRKQDEDAMRIYSNLRSKQQQQEMSRVREEIRDDVEKYGPSKHKRSGDKDKGPPAKRTGTRSQS